MLNRNMKEAEREGEYRVSKRIHAILLNDQGYTSGKIARIIQAPLSRVSHWLRMYDSFGYEALLEGHRSGRPSQLRPKDLELLADIIESGPSAYGYLSGVWTSAMVREVIRTEFGVSYHRSHICRMLHQLGFSVQRPRRKLIRADPRAQSRWRRYTYPRLKKKPRHNMQR